MICDVMTLHDLDGVGTGGLVHVNGVGDELTMLKDFLLHCLMMIDKSPRRYIRTQHLRLPALPLLNVHSFRRRTSEWIMRDRPSPSLSSSSGLKPPSRVFRRSQLTKTIDEDNLAFAALINTGSTAALSGTETCHLDGFAESVKEEADARVGVLGLGLLFGLRRFDLDDDLRMDGVIKDSRAFGSSSLVYLPIEGPVDDLDIHIHVSNGLKPP
jgi:hypothetical protein